MPRAPGLLHRLNRALHGPPEADPARQLVGDALRHQGRVQLGLLDLLDVELDLWVLGDLGQLGSQPVGFRPAPADHDAGPGGVDVDAEPVTGPLDLDPADRRPLELAGQVVADLPVLDQVVLVVPVVEPPRLPIGGDAEAKPVRVDLLAHLCLVFLVWLGGSSLDGLRLGTGVALGIGFALGPGLRLGDRLVRGFRLGVGAGRRLLAAVGLGLRRGLGLFRLDWLGLSPLRLRRLALGCLDVRRLRLGSVGCFVGRLRSGSSGSAGPPWRRSARDRWSPSDRRAPATRRARWASCSARRRASSRRSSSREAG